MADNIVAPGKTVRLIYTLRADSHEGEIMEEVSAEEAMEFVFGEQALLPKFEQAITGLKAGDTFSLEIPCEEAYGPELEEAYHEIEKSEFIADGEWDEELFQEGEVVPMETEDGEEVFGVVVEVKLNSIVVDFNHPLAGEDLFFDGEIVEVR